MGISGRFRARFILAAGFAISAALQGAVASAQNEAPAQSSAPSAADEVAQALDAAKIGDFDPVEALLGQGRASESELPLLQAQKAASLLRHDEASDWLALYLAGRDQGPERLSRAHALGAGSAFFAGNYGKAADHAVWLLARSGPDDTVLSDGWQRLHDIARLLSDHPPMKLESRGPGDPVAFAADKVGLLRTGIATASGSEEAVIDTGANLSVVSASAARRLGLPILDGGAQVGNSVGGGVDVRVAIADRLELAGAVLTHVPFLVIEDEALTFPVPGGYRIDAIIGLPVLAALGRMTFGPGDTLHLSSAQPGEAPDPNLRVVGSDPFLIARVEGMERPFFFDTGANKSLLSARFDSEAPDLRAGPTEQGRRAGAGGAHQFEERTIEQLRIEIGDVAATASGFRIASEPVPGEEKRYGTLGVDLLRLFRTFTIDFDRMRVEVEAHR